MAMHIRKIKKNTLKNLSARFTCQTYVAFVLAHATICTWCVYLSYQYHVHSRNK